MKAVVQRVEKACVEVEGVRVGAIEQGLLVYVGLKKGDSGAAEKWMLEKIFHLRILEEGGEQKSIVDVGGGILFVSQFTLYGSLLRGRRPSFDEAMPVDEARNAFAHFMKSAEAFPKGPNPIHIASGRFQADMRVHSVNSGPYTILLESPT